LHFIGVLLAVFLDEILLSARQIRIGYGALITFLAGSNDQENE
jgi:hypothetical protein